MACYESETSMMVLHSSIIRNCPEANISIRFVLPMEGIGLTSGI